MFVIKMNDDKTLSVTKSSTNYKNENKAETILFLFPAQYDSLLLSECSIQLYVLNPSGAGQTYTLTLEDDLYSQSYLQSYFSITSDITSTIGKYEVWINIINSDDSIVLKTNSTYITVSDSKDITEYFSSSNIETIDQIVIDIATLKEEVGRQKIYLISSDSELITLLAKQWDVAEKIETIEGSQFITKIWQLIGNTPTEESNWVPIQPYAMVY